MLRVFVVLLAALGVTVGYAAPSDACGVKLTVKSPKVKKRVKQTTYPSHILVLGAPPSKRLSKWLEQAGHTVESTKNASTAKRKDYAIVIADPEKVDEARSNFPRSRVVTRSGTLSSNVKKIERVLVGAPAGADEGTTVASRQASKRSRPAGVTQPQRLPRDTSTTEQKPEVKVAVVDKQEDEEPEVKEPEQDETDKQPEATVNSKTNDSQDEPDNEAKEPTSTPKRGKPARWNKEFFFGTNSTTLSDSVRSRLKDNVRWLADNPEVSITIEGHTDSSGPAEYNKVLGERRADAVREYLVEQGVDASRIEVISYGEERPGYSSDRKNRRVLIVKN